MSEIRKVSKINEKTACVGGLSHSAVREGFEPPNLLQLTVFKTAAFDHSAISPGAKLKQRVETAKFFYATFFTGIPGI